MAVTPSSLDLRQLAIGILYINLGRAAVTFPQSTPAHPSYIVFVDLVPPLGLLAESHRHYFPFRCRWDLWDQVVVPIFTDASVLVKTTTQTSGRNQIQRAALLIGDYETLLAKIEQAILRGYEAAGFVPAGTATWEAGAEPEAPGEPVTPPGINDGSPYSRFDGVIR